jgi:hypothetical protein
MERDSAEDLPKRGREVPPVPEPVSPNKRQRSEPAPVTELSYRDDSDSDSDSDDDYDSDPDLRAALALSAAEAEKPRSEKDAMRCNVCWDDVSKEKAVWLRCAHGFHGGCAVRWLSKYNKCPECMLPVEGPELGGR